MESILQHLVYKGCHADIRFDPLKMIFVGEIVNAPKTVSFQTDSADDIEAEFHRCVEKHLSFYHGITTSPTKATGPSLSSDTGDEIAHDDIIREYKNAVEATKALSECFEVSAAVRTEARRQYLIYKAGYEALLNPCRGCIHSSPLPPCQTGPMEPRQYGGSTHSTSQHRSSYTGACAGDCPSSKMVP